MCMIVTRDGVNPDRESERLHESMFMLPGRIRPKVRWRIVSIAIVPHDHAACGKSFWMAMWFILRNGGRRGTGMLWCRYVVASAVDMLHVIKRVGW